MNSGSRTTGNQSVSILGAKPSIGNRISRIVDAISASKQASPMRDEREHLTRAVELVQQRYVDWSRLEAPPLTAEEKNVHGISPR